MGFCSNEVVIAKNMQIRWKNVKILKIEKLNNDWSDSLKNWYVSTLARTHMIVCIFGRCLEFAIFHEFFCDFSHFWSKNLLLWNHKSDWFRTWYESLYGWLLSDLFKLWWNLHNYIFGEFFPFLVKNFFSLKPQILLIWNLVLMFLVLPQVPWPNPIHVWQYCVNILNFVFSVNIFFSILWP